MTCYLPDYFIQYICLIIGRKKKRERITHFLSGKNEKDVNDVDDSIALGILYRSTYKWDVITINSNRNISVLIFLPLFPRSHAINT